METIPKADCTKIGFIRKLHGVHGEVALEFEPQFDYSVEAANRFFVELEGLLVPFFVAEEGLRFSSGKTALIVFEDVTSKQYARRLVGRSVYLFNDEIIEAEGKEEQPPFLNYLLTDKKSGEIGIIKNAEDFSGNIVLTVDYHGSDILVPFNEDFIVSVNSAAKTITLNLPEGLIPD